MTTWKEIETQAFVTGSKLPKEIKETNENHEFLESTVDLLRKAEDVIVKLKADIYSKVTKYNRAKQDMDQEALKKLNAEAPILKTIIDSNFEMTINGLIAKPEWETKEETKTRLEKEFKLTK